MAVDERTIDERWQDYWRDKRGTTAEREQAERERETAERFARVEASNRMAERLNAMAKVEAMKPVMGLNEIREHDRFMRGQPSQWPEMAARLEQQKQQYEAAKAQLEQALAEQEQVAAQVGGPVERGRARAALREAAGLTPEELGEYCNLPADTVRSYEAGSEPDAIGGASYVQWLSDVANAMQQEQEEQQRQQSEPFYR